MYNNKSIQTTVDGIYNIITVHLMIMDILIVLNFFHIATCNHLVID